MNKRFCTLLLLAFLTISCGKSGGGGGSGSSAEADLQDVSPETADLAQTFVTNVELIDFASRETKMRDAIDIVKLVVGTEEFKRRVLNHTYNGSKTYVDNRGYSNAQIYKIILEAAEKLQPAKNNRMDMDVEMYTASNNVVGYTYPSTTRVWVNTKFFDQYTAAGVARNLFHEWLHKLGFGHDVNWSSSRDYSVPYAIGSIVADIGKQFL